MTKTTKIHNSIQLLAPRPYLKVPSQFIHQSVDSRKRCHVNKQDKPLAWSAYLLSKTFWEVVGVKFYSTVRLNFLYWQFKKTDGLLVYDVKLSLNVQRFDDAFKSSTWYHKCGSPVFFLSVLTDYQLIVSWVCKVGRFTTMWDSIETLKFQRDGLKR